MQEIGKLMHKHVFEWYYSNKSKDSKKQNNHLGDSENKKCFFNLVCLL